MKREVILLSLELSSLKKQQADEGVLSCVQQLGTHNHFTGGKLGGAREPSSPEETLFCEASKGPRAELPGSRISAQWREEHSFPPELLGNAMG